MRKLLNILGLILIFPILFGLCTLVSIRTHVHTYTSELDASDHYTHGFVHGLVLATMATVIWSCLCGGIWKLGMHLLSLL